MTPIKHTLKNNIVRFDYKSEPYNEWLSQGVKTGDVGFLLMGIDYGLGFYLYEGFGTIEAPYKELRKIDMQHDDVYDGKISTIEDIMSPPKTKPNYNTSFSFAILDFSKL